MGPNRLSISSLFLFLLLSSKNALSGADYVASYSGAGYSSDNAVPAAAPADNSGGSASYSGSGYSSNNAIPASPAGSGFDCSTVQDGDYPGSGSACSSSYISCVAGEAIDRHCGDDKLRFDVSSVRCLQPEFVAACGGAATPIPPAPPMSPPADSASFDCSIHPDGDYENPFQTCSNSYFSCVGGRAFARVCGEGQNVAFDSISGSCLDKAYVQSCGGYPTTTVIPPPAPSDMPDLGVDCKGKPDGYYEDARYQCSVYYTACVGGLALPLKCAADFTRFDMTSLRCLEPDFVAACGGTPTEIQQQTTVSLPDMGFDCSSLSDGDYQNTKEACSVTYFSCVGGQVWVRQCSDPHLRFDSISGGCMEQEFVQACGGTPTTAAPPPPPADVPDLGVDCSNKPDGFYEDARYPCSKHYAACIGGHATPLVCPGDKLRFDITSNSCMEQQYVAACGGNPTVPSQTTPAAQPPDMGFDCNNLPDGDFQNTKESCSATYFSCINGHALARFCSETTLRYDVDTNQCLSPAYVKSCGGTPASPAAPPSAYKPSSYNYPAARPVAPPAAPPAAYKPSSNYPAARPAAPPAAYNYPSAGPVAPPAAPPAAYNYPSAGPVAPPAAPPAAYNNYPAAPPAAPPAAKYPSYSYSSQTTTQPAAPPSTSKPYYYPRPTTTAPAAPPVTTTRVYYQTPKQSYYYPSTTTQPAAPPSNNYAYGSYKNPSG